ncbi:MAG: hypothetical protein AB8B55_05355 [Mariniblastus sp.]
MNVQSKPFKIDLKKIAIIAVVLSIAGYQWYVKNNPAKPAVAGGDKIENRSPDEYKVNFPNSEKSGNEKSSNGKLGLKIPDFGNSDSGKTRPGKSTSGSSAKKSSTDSGPYLKASGRNQESPEGLLYTMGPGGEHRTDHVLRHAEDQPNRPTHGVFTAKGDDVFRLVDEAYALVKSKSKQVKSESSRGNMAHIIDMKRKIGFKGGQSGKRKNNPPLYKVKLILSKNRVITAYPY